MSQRQRFCLALCLCVTIALVGCKSKKTMATTDITISTDGSNNCTQNGAINTNVPIGTDGVTWVAPNTGSLYITFNAGCGFANGCTFGPTTSPIQSGAVSSTTGTVIPYATIKINNNACNVGSDGLIMH